MAMHGCALQHMLRNRFDLRIGVKAFPLSVLVLIRHVDLHVTTLPRGSTEKLFTKINIGLVIHNRTAGRPSENVWHRRSTLSQKVFGFYSVHTTLRFIQMCGFKLDLLVQGNHSVQR